MMQALKIDEEIREKIPRGAFCVQVKVNGKMDIIFISIKM